MSIIQQAQLSNDAHAHKHHQLCTYIIHIINMSEQKRESLGFESHIILHEKIFPTTIFPKVVKS